MLKKETILELLSFAFEKDNKTFSEESKNLQTENIGKYVILR
jgi:hypothetical protein